MLGIPIFAEQGWNCGRAQHRGIARSLSLMDFATDDLYRTIRELIDNATYRNNIRRISEIWRDEPMIGCKKAGFWLNHVIKYGGEHLRSPYLNQPLYQYFMLDILAIFLAVIAGFIVLARYVLGLVMLLKIKRKDA
jgi:glucuronosyltransferase